MVVLVKQKQPLCYFYKMNIYFSMSTSCLLSSLTMENLPVELHVHIASLLPLYSLSRLSCLSHYWHDLFQEQFQPKLAKLSLWVITTGKKKETYLSLTPNKFDLHPLVLSEYTIAWRFPLFYLQEALRNKVSTLRVKLRRLVTSSAGQKSYGYFAPQQLRLEIKQDTGYRLLAESRGYAEKQLLPLQGASPSGGELVEYSPAQHRNHWQANVYAIDLHCQSLLSSSFADLLGEERVMENKQDRKLVLKQGNGEKILWQNKIENLHSYFSTLRWGDGDDELYRNSRGDVQINAKITPWAKSALRAFFPPPPNEERRASTPEVVVPVIPMPQLPLVTIEVIPLRGHPDLYKEVTRGWICRLVGNYDLVAIGRMHGEEIVWSLTEEEKRECLAMGIGCE